MFFCVCCMYMKCVYVCMLYKIQVFVPMPYGGQRRMFGALLSVTQLSQGPGWWPESYIDLPVSAFHMLVIIDACEHTHSFFSRVLCIQTQVLLELFPAEPFL